MNLEFFETLYGDQEFCEILGRMTLAAGRFESNLRAFLNLNGVTVPESQASLGRLTSELKKHDLLSENGVEILRLLKRQRNYLMHSLFDLFSERVSETVLPRTDLDPIDVGVFVDAAWVLEQNLSGLSSIVEERITQLEDPTLSPSEQDRRLWRP